MSKFTDKVVAQCLTEFERFKKGKGRENVAPFSDFVGEYWRVGVNNKNINGKTTFQSADGKSFRPAWSSAFISFILKQSGAGKAFFYHEAHIHYAVKAIRDAKAGDSTAKFLGRDPKNYAPKPGDIINAGRGSAKSVKFSTVLTRYGKKAVPDGNFLATHSDIVIQVNFAKGELTTIGGNVAVDTVGKKILPMKADGTLKNPDTFITVIECLL